MPRLIEPVSNVARTFAEADAWEIEQLARLTLDQRLEIAELLKRRAYGTDQPDVREFERRR
ncbi:MAG: hypothetical protein ABIR79_19395 [Candidatus Binatia bacterium]